MLLCARFLFLLCKFSERSKNGESSCYEFGFSLWVYEYPTPRMPPIGQMAYFGNMEYRNVDLVGIGIFSVPHGFLFREGLLSAALCAERHIEHRQAIGSLFIFHIQR